MDVGWNAAATTAGVFTIDLRQAVRGRCVVKNRPRSHCKIGRIEASDMGTSRSTPIPHFLVIAFLFLATGHSLGLERVGGQALGAEPSTDAYSAIVATSEEATTLLQRADEAIGRADWKVAIDSLQRIVELPGEHLLTADQKTYTSARQYAHRRIGSLPPEGLAAYRLLYDAEAGALFEQAVESHDASLMRDIFARYRMTSHGDDVAVQLASWLMDESRFAEASNLLRAVRTDYPDTDVPDWELTMRQAMCAAAMRQPESAKRLLGQFLSFAGDSGGDGFSKDEFDALQARVKAFVEGEGHIGGAGGASDDWPMFMGHGDRRGVMPDVDPAFLDHLPWDLSLPAVEPRQGFAALVEYARERHLFPSRHLVTDGKVLIAKGTHDLVAIDLDSFEQRWRSHDARLADQTAGNVNEVMEAQQRVQVQQLQRRSFGRPNDPADEMRDDPIARRLMWDSVGSGVTLAYDRVFTVEWSGEPPMPSDWDAMPGRRRFNPYGNIPPVVPNRITSYSLATGALQWTSAIYESSSTASANDGDAEADGEAAVDPNTSLIEFLGPPVPANDMLVAPYRKNTDLYAAVIDPTNGVTQQSIYLCGAGGAMFESLHALDGCVADGVVFMPTGRGLLVAIEAATWSIRWAVRYDEPSENLFDAGWLPCPVVAVSDVVLLAPGEADRLLCFDRSTGHLRWSVPRDSAQYIVGANDERVWLAGGSSAGAVSVETGDSIWQMDIGESTGRGVVSGGKLYFPTVDSLVRVNAMTGEAEPMPLAPDDEALGNLLAWDAALYSISFSSVRKFPDLERGYAEASTRYKADPKDPSRAIRLAWLELLKQNPKNALAALSTVPNEVMNEAPAQREHVTKLRVRSLMELAAASHSQPDEARGYLEQARAISISPEDGIATALALGDLHQVQGRSLDACREYLSIVVSERGDITMRGGGGTQQRARAQALQRIADAAGGLSPADEATLHGDIQRRLEQAEAATDRKTVARLSEFDFFGDAAPLADLILGRWALGELQYEKAEQYFHNVLRRSDTPALRAEATARLAAISLEPDELHQPVTAVALIETLEIQYADVLIPRDALTVAPDAATDTLPCGDAAALLRERVDDEILTRHRQALSPCELGEPGEPTAGFSEAMRPLSPRGPRVEPLADTILGLTHGNTIDVFSVDEGKEPLWSTELALLGEQAIDTRTETITLQRTYQFPRSAYVAARGVMSGQTLMLNSPYGLHAVGVLTGRRLWSYAYQPPYRSQLANDPSGFDAWLWAHDGYLITVDAKRHLEVRRVEDGDVLLWRAEMAQRQWHYVRARGDFVVAASQDLKQVDIFRLSDGRYLGMCRFEQPDDRKISLSLFDDVVCGPVSETDIAAIDLATPGIERWRKGTKDALMQINKPDESTLALGDVLGRVLIVDPKTGRELLSVTTGACRAGVIGAVRSGDAYYVYGFDQRVQEQQQQPHKFDDQRWGIAALDAATGKVRWELADIKARTFLSDEIFSESANAIPLAALVPPAEELNQPMRHHTSGRAASVELTLIDKRNGKPIGEPSSVTLNDDPAARLILDVQVRPGQVLVMPGSSQLRFPCPAAASDQILGEAGER